MGLSVCVGILGELAGFDSEGADWAREQFAMLDEVLLASKLAPHREPEHVELRSRAELDGYPYGWIHCLRRAYAHALLHPKDRLTPLPDGVDGDGDRDVGALVTELTSHLLTHSDAEGFYVPIDFRHVIVDERLPGTMLGSTPRLLSELVAVAPAIDIALVRGDIPQDTIDAINEDVDGASPFWRERMIWLGLFEAARISLATGAAIVFT